MRHGTTAPQIFVAGELVGGSTEVLDAWQSGSFQELLAANRVDYDREAKLDPYSFRPAWLHARSGG